MLILRHSKYIKLYAFIEFYLCLTHNDLILILPLSGDRMIPH